jgi:hypothetical protein
VQRHWKTLESSQVSQFLAEIETDWWMSELTQVPLTIALTPICHALANCPITVCTQGVAVNINIFTSLANQNPRIFWQNFNFFTIVVMPSYLRAKSRLFFFDFFGAQCPRINSADAEDF